MWLRPKSSVGGLYRSLIPLSNEAVALIIITREATRRCGRLIGRTLYSRFMCLQGCGGSSPPFGTSYLDDITPEARTSCVIACVVCAAD